MKQGIAVADDHHLHIFHLGIYVVFKTFSIIIAGLFIITKHIVGLTDLKIQVRIVRIFFQHL